MADVPGKDDSTSGPLAWLLAVSLVSLTLALPTVVVSAFLFTFFVVLDSVVGLPAIT